MKHINRVLNFTFKSKEWDIVDNGEKLHYQSNEYSFFNSNAINMISIEELR
jgi:hypothetical protein